MADGNEMEDLATRVRVARNARHWSQAALAVAAGVNEKTVRRLEAGSVVAPETVLAVCGALGIEAEAVRRPTPAPEPRLALPGDPPSSIIRTLTAHAAASDVVMAVDTKAYLKAMLGPDPEGTLDRDRSLTRFAEVLCLGGVIASQVGITGLYMGQAGWAKWMAVLGVLAATAGFLVLMTRAQSVDDTATVNVRNRLIDFRQCIYAIGRTEVTRIRLDGNGAVVREVMPFRVGSKASPGSDPAFLNFVFQLHGRRLEIPCVPRTPASEALAASLA